MRSLLKGYLISLAAIYLISMNLVGFQLARIENLVIFALFTLAIKYFQRPLFAFLFLPRNIIIELAAQTVLLGLLLSTVTLFLPSVKVTAFTFEGLTYQGFIIPSMSFSLPGAVAIVAVSISLTIFFLEWVFH